jgi:hypothetical protein
MARFAEVSDVTSRFEGTIPSDREEWVQTRIDDVEAVLTGLVPSLAASWDDIDDGRKARVKALVCDKVLDLYRNPGRVNQQTQTSGPYSESTTFLSGLAQRGVGGISFSPDELRGVRLRNRRTNLGNTKLAPWRPERDPVLHRYGYPDVGC